MSSYGFSVGSRTWLLAAVVAVAGLHPRDGADVDVRVRIEREAVRLDLIFNLVYVDEVAPVPRAAEAELDAREARAVRGALFEHLREALAVEVDGVALEPVDAGFAFTPAEPGAAELFPAFGTRAAARVRLDLAYPTQAPPAQVAIEWGSFPPDAVRSTAAGAPPVEVRAVVLHEAGEELVRFTADAPRFEWRADGAAAPDPAELPATPVLARRTFPGLSVLLCALLAATAGACFLREELRRFRRPVALAAPFVLAGAATAHALWRVPVPFTHPVAALPTAPQAAAIFRPLHANIYRAFDHRNESEAYDTLARSVEGELLDRVYREVHRSLVLQEADGAVARVERVRPLEARVESIERAPDGAARFIVDARWQVDGIVRHWGHAHERTNEHRARYRVVGRSGGWRIDACEVLEHRRVDASPLPAGIERP